MLERAREEVGLETWSRIVARQVTLKASPRGIEINDMPEDEIESWANQRERCAMWDWDFHGRQADKKVRNHKDGTMSRLIAAQCGQCTANKRRCEYATASDPAIACRGCLLHGVDCDRPWREIAGPSSSV